MAGGASDPRKPPPLAVGCTRCKNGRRFPLFGEIQRIRWGWGFSKSQDFTGDIALIACFASSWTPAMVRRWHADVRLPAAMGRGACAHRECATLHAPLDRHRRGHLPDGVASWTARKIVQGIAAIVAVIFATRVA